MDIDIVNWGKDNLEPLHLLGYINSNSLLNSALDFKTKALFKKGLQYGYEENGQFVPASIPVIDRFIDNQQIKKGLANFFKLGISFAEIILSKDQKYVTNIGFIDSPLCRLGKTKAGKEYCLVSEAWSIHPYTVDREYTTVIERIPKSAYPPEWLREQGAGHKYILPINPFTLGGGEYGEPNWTSIQKSGWLDYFNDIATFKLSNLENSSHVKYAIHVPESWWEWKYPHWEDMTREEKASARTNEHRRFDTFVSGYENAGGSLILTYKDKAGLKEQGYDKWEIQVIQGNLDTSLNKDVEIVGKMIIRAAGLHDSLLGVLGSNTVSGEEQAAAYQIHQLTSKADEDIFLHPFRIAAAYCGYPHLKFRFKD